MSRGLRPDAWKYVHVHGNLHNNFGDIQSKITKYMGDLGKVKTQKEASDINSKVSAIVKKSGVIKVGAAAPLAQCVQLARAVDKFYTYYGELLSVKENVVSAKNKLDAMKVTSVEDVETVKTVKVMIKTFLTASKIFSFLMDDMHRIVRAGISQSGINKGSAKSDKKEDDEKGEKK